MMLSKRKDGWILVFILGMTVSIALTESSGFLGNGTEEAGNSSTMSVTALVTPSQQPVYNATNVVTIEIRHTSEEMTTGTTSMPTTTSTTTTTTSTTTTESTTEEPKGWNHRCNNSKNYQQCIDGYICSDHTNRCECPPRTSFSLTKNVCKPDEYWTRLDWTYTSEGRSSPLSWQFQEPDAAKDVQKYTLSFCKKMRGCINPLEIEVSNGSYTLFDLPKGKNYNVKMLLTLTSGRLPLATDGINFYYCYDSEMEAVGTDMFAQLKHIDFKISLTDGCFGALNAVLRDGKDAGKSMNFTFNTDRKCVTQGTSYDKWLAVLPAYGQLGSSFSVEYSLQSFCKPNNPDYKHTQDLHTQPGPPKNVKFEVVGPDYLTVTWENPDEGDVDYYGVYVWNTEGQSDVYNVSSTHPSLNITDLESGKKFKIVVHSFYRGNAATGEFIDAVTVKHVPRTPVSVAWNRRFNKLTWSVARPEDGDTDYFNVTYNCTKSGNRQMETKGIHQYFYNILSDECCSFEVFGVNARGKGQSADIKIYPEYPTASMCRKGWNLYPGDNKCIKQFSRLSWKLSRDSCKSKGGNLVTIDTPAKNDFLYGLDYHGWIGLRKAPNKFVWLDGTKPKFTAWYKDQPNNADGNEECIALITDLLWADKTCSDTRTFVCEKPSINSQLACPNGWHHYAGGKTCVWISTSTKTWYDARRYCREVLDGQLIKINDVDTHNFLYGVYQKQNFRGWIGLSSTPFKFLWQDGTKPTFTYWDEGEPNNDLGVEECTEVRGDLKWNDVPCHINKGYICEKTVGSAADCSSGWNYYSWAKTCIQMYGSHRYGSDKSFQNAKLACERLGANLIKIDTKAKNDFLLGLYRGTSFHGWIGLSYSTDRFAWVDGAKAKFTNWDDNEPNSVGGNEDCTELVGNGRWNDNECDRRDYFICEIDTEKYQPVDRLDYKADGATNADIIWDIDSDIKEGGVYMFEVTLYQGQEILAKLVKLCKGEGCLYPCDFQVPEASLTFSSSQRSFLVSFPVTPDSSYSVGVMSITASWTADQKMLSFTTPKPPPSSPIVGFQVLNVSTHQLIAQWNPPTERNGDILRYDVQLVYLRQDCSLLPSSDHYYTPTTSHRSIEFDPGNWYVLRDLLPYTSYNISVTTITEGGRSLIWSQPVTFRTDSKHDNSSIGNVTKMIGSNFIKLSWERPCPITDSPVYWIEVIRDDDAAPMEFGTSETSINIPDLSPNTTYKINIGRKGTDTYTEIEARTEIGNTRALVQNPEDEDKGSGDNSGLAIGLTCGCIVVVVAIVVGVIVYRKRQSSTQAMRRLQRSSICVSDNVRFCSTELSEATIDGHND